MPEAGVAIPVRNFVAPDPDYASRVRASFARQGAMRLIGARLVALRPGHCTIDVEHRSDLTQQHGYIHAGIVSALVDSAGGFAGYTLF
ncbi:MAG TPA: phenylacetic acid degradation protein, partial [Casimicrobiaceae bacterium]